MSRIFWTLMVAAALTNNATGAVTIVVKGEDGAILVGATVVIRTDEGRRIIDPPAGVDPITDKNGKFTHPNAPDPNEKEPNYRVRVTPSVADKNKYDVKTKRVLNMKNGDTIEVILKKITIP